MAGGKNKIHEHPNAGKSTFRERPEDINRAGREKGSHDFETLINMALEKRGVKEKARFFMAEKIIDVILNEKASDKDKLKAIKEIGDRLFPIKNVIELDSNTQDMLRSQAEANKKYLEKVGKTNKS